MGSVGLPTGIPDHLIGLLSYAADINTVKTQASEASGRGWASLDCKIWDGEEFELSVASVPYERSSKYYRVPKTLDAFVLLRHDSSRKSPIFELRLCDRLMCSGDVLSRGQGEELEGGCYIRGDNLVDTFLQGVRSCHEE
ncbi:hypothetical protein JOM56_014642 [Amanita muscaria]